MVEGSDGKVWLVGAGPGDIGLFTLKGMKVLEEAQVVVYDSLVGESILSKIPEQAEAINVGKRASHHTMPQTEINQLLVDKAKKGYKVVRLKGGDPFLFGRGGEEVELLVKEHIPYEVIPGITSSIAVPAYSGIPVTHRDFCSSLHIVTGHKKKNEPYDIDFQALVNTKGTLVFLMGVGSLKEICDSLLKAGMRKEMPAAILQRGTTARQKKIVATVETLYEEVQKQGVMTPAIIVVGEVCSLAKNWNWYEKLPLFGRKILVTRPRNAGTQLSETLRGYGAEVLDLPTIKTSPLKDQRQLDQAFGNLKNYEWVVFTSPMAVRVFFEEMHKKKIDIRTLGKIKIAAIGQGTKERLEEKGLFVDLVPQIYDGEHLGRALCKECIGEERILIPRAQMGGPELIKELQRKPGLKIEEVPIYETVYTSGDRIDEKRLIEKEEIDWVIFTSSSTVRGFVESLHGLDFRKVKAICIGKQTKATADGFGMQTEMAKKATIESIVQVILQKVSKER